MPRELPPRTAHRPEHATAPTRCHAKIIVLDEFNGETYRRKKCAYAYVRQLPNHYILFMHVKV